MIRGLHSMGRFTRFENSAVSTSPRFIAAAETRSSHGRRPKRIVSSTTTSGGAGFTLLEVLISLALVALVLVAMNTFIFSMSELWGKNNDVRAFDQHVRSVTRFLETELRSASMPPVAAPGETPVAPKDVRNHAGVTEQLLTFELPAGTRLISWPERPLPDVVCSLEVRDHEGLILLWHSRIEKRFDQDPPRETVITPLVSAMSFDYYDTDFKRWKTETTLLKDAGGAVKPPQRLRLKFTYGKLTRESLVELPLPVEGMPAF